ncbi:histidine phosphatase family protein [Colwellia sp. D2M02]|uniref:histidine phosphatase family protein n=1 Tax=Colwellia sp. D2M02 TaxID=2841562 RepID=UPI001C0993F3|nr:histidine phosphatase family protein [Colwellia sp. D2M02]MBU2892167.1 histidine phosphatase family protein [Colwellia sp. D2M02]
MLQIELVRHVKVEGRAALYGKTDVAPKAADNDLLIAALLKRSELRQTRTATNTLKLPAIYQQIFSSPLQRCVLAAKQLAQLTHAPLLIKDDFQEMNFGRYDGVLFDELPFDKQESISISGLHWNTLEEFFQSPANVILPQAESLTEFHQRVISAWKSLLTQQLSLQTTQGLQPRRIIIFAHGGVIRMILAHVLQLNWQQASWYQNLHIGYGSLTQLSVRSIDDNSSSPTHSQNIDQSASSHDYFTQVNTIAMPLLDE